MRQLVDWKFTEDNLLYIFNEMKIQNMSKYNCEGCNTWKGTIDQIYEFIDLAGEYALAYEFIIFELERLPYKISGKASIKLLELAVIFKYKSEDKDDECFDFRERCKDCD